MVNKYKALDVVLVDFGKAEFAGEIAGKRPAVIIQNRMGNLYSSTTLVMPFTSKQKKLDQSTHSLFKKDLRVGLTEDSILLGECLRQISEKRIIKKLGEVTDNYYKTEIKRVRDANFEEF